jgi:hypothetical protein
MKGNILRVRIHEGPSVAGQMVVADTWPKGEPEKYVELSSASELAKQGK